MPEFQREMQITVAFVARRPQLADRSQRRSVERILGHQPPGFRVADEQSAAIERQRADAVQGQRAQHDARRSPPRQDESTGANAGGVEDLHALPAVGRVGHRKAAVHRDIERARLDQPSFFSADLHELAGVGAGGADKVHGVAASVEDVVVAVGRLLEADWIAKESDDVRAASALTDLRISTAPGERREGCAEVVARSQ